MPMNERSRLQDALLAARGLPQHDVEAISVLVDAGEEALALETLCTQIYEYDVGLSDTLRSELGELGDVLDVDVAYLLGDPWADRRGGSGGGR